MKVRPALALAAGCMAAIASAQSPPMVNRVVIESDWIGLGPGPQSTKLILQREAGRFRLTGTIKDAASAKAVPPRDVDAADVALLVAGLRAPALPHAPLARLVPDVARLLHRVEAKDSPLGSRYPQPAQKAFIEAVLHDRAQLTEAIERGYSSMHTDDYPTVEIRVTLADGSVLLASSRSQHALMLPWDRKPGGVTWSPAIADALSKLLPEQATNRSRLDGEGAESDLDDVLSAGLYAPLQRLGNGPAH